MSTDYDGLFPAGQETRNAWDDDGFTKHGPAEDVADGAIRGKPH